MKTLINIAESVIFWIGAFVTTFFFIGLLVGFDAKVKIGGMDKEEAQLLSKADSLQLVVDDLEAKIEILNRYLVQKHIEYIDACDLKTEP